MVADTQLDFYIAAIHGSVFKHPLETFKEESLPILASLIPFDAGLWATGGADDGRIHSVATIGFPRDALLDYASRWQEHDFVRAAATADPGRAYRNEDVMRMADYHHTHIYREFSGPSSIEHALALTIVDPITRVGELFYLFRRTRDAFFSNGECQMLERLGPHLADSWRHRQMLHSYEHFRLPPEILSSRGIARAIIDAEGQIHSSEPKFGLILRQAFPAWSGPLIPMHLKRLLNGHELCFDVAGLRLTLYRGDTRHLLVAEPRGFTIPLTPAELRVALGCVAGKTVPALAAQFGLSQRTIRNQLTSVYQKLGVHSRVQLVKKIEDLGMYQAGRPRSS